MAEYADNSAVSFYKAFLQMRKRYYYHQTKALLARHKLLLGLIILLIVPGISNLPVIGTPFSELISPLIPVPKKIIILLSVLLILFLFTRAQGESIRGGVFRDYLETLWMPLSIRKKIDMIILLISLNFVWIALWFGVSQVSALSLTPILLFSYDAIYFSMVIAIIVFLLNSLYKNTLIQLWIILSIILICVISNYQNAELNGITSLLVMINNIICYAKTQPRKIGYRFRQKSLNENRVKSITKIPNLLVLPMATYRKNKIVFQLRILVCIFIALLLCFVFAMKIIDQRSSICFFIVWNVVAYVLCTLFTFFVEDERLYQRFHQIYRTSLFTKRVLEILIIFTLQSILLIAIFTVLPLYSVYFISLILMIMASNIIVVSVNRYLYELSNQYCLIASMLIMVITIFLQTRLIGVFFGNAY